MPVNVVALLMVFVLSSTQDVPVIDLATAPVQKQMRPPTKGMVVGGVPGGKPSWPLRMELISAREEADVNAPALVYEFELRNTGTEPIDLPVDPSPRDVEPADPAVTSYRYVNASVTLEARPQSAGIKAESLHLYGTEFAAGTIRRLAPKSAIRIRAKANVARTSLNTGGDSLTISATFSLHRSSVTGDTLEERQIIGPIESSNTVQVAIR